MRSIKKSGLRQNISKHMKWFIPRTGPQIIRPRPKQLLVPSRFSQRGIIMATGALSDKTTGMVKLTDWGTLFSDNGASGGGLATCSIRFDQFGGDETGELVFIQVGTSKSGTVPANEWWTTHPDSSNPPDNVSGDYDVRCASATSGTFDFSPQPIGTWQVTIADGNNPYSVRCLDKESPKDSDVQGAVFQIRTTVGQTIVASNSGVRMRARN